MKPKFTKPMFTTLCIATTLTLFSACTDSKSGVKRYESIVQIVSKKTVEKDVSGKPLVVDFLLEWDPCPGDQFQMIRAGQDFSSCMDHYKEGDMLPVIVEHQKDEKSGAYFSDIRKVGDCSRTPEAFSEGSFEKSQECQEVTNFGQNVGFFCLRKPVESLIQVCPWMKK